ncbi:MAG TPA: molybdopterin-dependent oxidoreductase [Solirubrobacteraceae bacterium]
MATAFTTCPLCEATCGLEITVADGAVTRIRGDADDVLSHGFVCPKGASLQELHEDPDRLRTPLVRRPNGELHPASWDEAFAEIDRRLPAIRDEHGNDAVAVYIGNPSAHNLSTLVYGRVLLKALRTRNIFSASTVDQYPKQMASALMFGSGATVAVPDVDRTDHLLILGANPLASNGSLLTAPDMRGRLRAIRARGGKVVVVDPRRTRTAREADEHHFIRPGSDALLLIALVHTLFAEDLAEPGALAEHVSGLDAVRELAAGFAPEAVAGACGIAAPEIRRMGRQLAAAPRAAVYGRIGTTTQRFGTTASWLVDVLNVITGNLDRPGGAMFPLPATGSSNTAGEPGRGRGAQFGRWHSRVRGLGEIFGELPAVCLAEEIETPGEGQVRALITVAGNPAVSTPNSERLAAALETLDFMVSVDVYLNETTRHADVILPGPSPLQRSHYDLALSGFAVRNVANYSPPALQPDPSIPAEWETLLRLAAIVSGQGADADVAAIDRLIALDVASRMDGDAEELLAAVEPRVGPERILDLRLRGGPYELTLADLEAAPHGIDLGPLQPRMPEALRTPSGKIELAPEALVADVARLHEALAEPVNGGMVLIGRRDVRSNNSWMHNLPKLVRGRPRCTAHVHPGDAERLGLADGEVAVVRSRAGAIVVPIEVTADVMPGVVSIPHGWGHDLPGVALAVAGEHAGTNSNVLADELLVEPLSGTAVLNGIPIELAPVTAA